MTRRSIALCAIRILSNVLFVNAHVSVVKQSADRTQDSKIRVLTFWSLSVASTSLMLWKAAQPALILLLISASSVLVQEVDRTR